MTKTCYGYGECLECEGRNNYVKCKYISCEYYCEPVRCKNYILCNNKFPEYYNNYSDSKGVCDDCYKRFGTWDKMPNGNVGKGTLEMIDNMKCSCCQKDGICISQPYCDHSLCVECFKNRYGYNWKYHIEKPAFPYSQSVLNKYNNLEYQKDIQNYENKYPLIVEYNYAYENWESERIKAYEKIKKISEICPVCKITKEIKYNRMKINDKIMLYL
jgi:hypothetical protein